MKYGQRDERPPLSRETKNKISTCKLNNRNRWIVKLDAMYAEAKELVAKGVNVSCACKATGLTRDQFYRRRRIETTGKDRKK